MENKKKQAVIFDIEGTLSDCSARIHHYENKDYDAWNKGFLDDPPNGRIIGYLCGHRLCGTEIILCTAKSIKYKADVELWLSKAGLAGKFQKVLYRDKLDSRPSTLVKRDMLFGLAEEYVVIEAWDDRDDICEMYRSYGVKAISAGVERKAGPVKELSEASDLFQERNSVYGDAYLRHGKIISEYFPNGIELKTEKDFFRFHMFNLDVMKSNRIASNLVAHRNHSDSWADKIVYSSMVKGV